MTVNFAVKISTIPNGCIFGGKKEKKEKEKKTGFSKKKEILHKSKGLK